MKITIAMLALVAYAAIADITYDFTRHHGFERPTCSWPETDEKPAK